MSYILAAAFYVGTLASAIANDPCQVGDGCSMQQNRSLPAFDDAPVLDKHFAERMDASRVIEAKQDTVDSSMLAIQTALLQTLIHMQQTQYEILDAVHQLQVSKGHD